MRRRLLTGVGPTWTRGEMIPDDFIQCQEMQGKCSGSDVGRK